MNKAPNTHIYSHIYKKNINSGKAFNILIYTNY